jgi:hypothetical protein
MAADFLGAMFQGIGDTFKAGASVNVAKIAERSNTAINKTNLEAIYYENENAKLTFLNEAAKIQFKQQLLIAGALVALVVVALIFKKN